MNLDDFVKNSCFRVIVKPNAEKTEVLGYDKERQAIKIAVMAQADKNKANLELIKFLSKRLKRKVCIKSGLTGRKKIVCIA